MFRQQNSPHSRTYHNFGTRSTLRYLITERVRNGVDPWGELAKDVIAEQSRAEGRKGGFWRGKDGAGRSEVYDGLDAGREAAVKGE